MKNPTFDSFLALMDEVARAFGKLLRRSVHTVGAMSWPAIMLSCVAIALMLTIVPLALFLFLLFMAIKLIVASIAIGARRGKATPYRDAKDKEE
ncbi:MAG: hypothetical protein V4508_18145 [Pseudomonadota bacterium]